MKKTAIYLLSFLTAAFMLLAVCFTAFGGVNAVRADDEEEEQKIIDVTMGENFSPAQFGSATAVNIAEGEKLVYSFDLAYAVVAASNIFVGAVVSAYPVGTNSYPMVTLDRTIQIYGNWAFGAPYDAHCYVGKTDRILSGQRFNPSEIFASGNTVKYEYAPYLSDAEKGSFKLFVKESKQPDESFRLVAAIENLGANDAPRDNVYIYLTSQYAYESTPVNYGFLNYSLTCGDKTIPATEAYNSTMTLKDPPPTKVEHAVLDYISTGYFSANSTFDFDEAGEVYIEADVLRANSDVGGMWAGFAVATALSKYMYTSGALCYFTTNYNARVQTVNGTVESAAPWTEAGSVFRSGTSFKAKLVSAEKRMYVYTKDITDEEYGEPVAVFGLQNVLKGKMYLGICVQYGLKMELKNLRYVVDGEETAVSFSWNEDYVNYTDTDVPVYDSVLSLAASGNGTEEARTELVYKKSLYSSDQVTFRSLAEQNVTLFVEDGENETPLNLDLLKGEYRAAFADGKFTVYDKDDNVVGSAYAAYDSFRFGFSVRNALKTAKRVLLDDVTVTYGNKTAFYDFNLGIDLDSWEKRITGKGRAEVPLETFDVTYHYPDGTIADKQTVGMYADAVIPAGEYQNYESVKMLSERIDTDRSILLIRTTDDVDYYVLSAENGRFDDTEKSVLFVKKGVRVKLSANPPSIGKYFAGWYEGDTLYEENETFEFDAEKTLHLTARYEFIKYTVTISGGTCLGETSAIGIYGEAIQLVANAPEEGTIFAGWYEGETLLGSKRKLTYYVSGSAEVAARFVKKDVTLTVVNGTSDGKNLLNLSYGDEVTVTADEANDGYHFSGWYKNGEKIAEIQTITVKITGDTELTARFTKNKYSVKATGGKVNGYDSVIAEYGDEVTVTWDKTDGEKFLGWYEGETLVSEEESYTFAVASDKTFVAKTEKAAAGSCKSVVNGNMLTFVAAISVAGAGVLIIKKRRKTNDR